MTEYERIWTACVSHCRQRLNPAHFSSKSAALEHAIDRLSGEDIDVEKDDFEQVAEFCWRVDRGHWSGIVTNPPVFETAKAAEQFGGERTTEDSAATASGGEDRE